MEDSVMEGSVSRREHEEFRRTFNEKIESLKAEDKRINARLTALEKFTEQIQDLVVSVNKLANNIESMCETQKQEGKRLEALESRDGEMWRKVTGYMVTAVVGIILGFIFNQIGM